MLTYVVSDSSTTHMMPNVADECVTLARNPTIALIVSDSSFHVRIRIESVARYRMEHPEKTAKLSTRVQVY
jgi:hypothetical protein